MADDNTQDLILEMVEQMGGIEQFQSNPMAFIGEVFKHPELLSKIDQLAKTPEMQKQISESMNNPMFQQIVANNPMLAGMMNNYKNHQNSYSADSEDDSCIDADLDDIQVNGFDFAIPGWKPVDWLNPLSNQPFFVSQDDSQRIHFDDVLADLPEECRDTVRAIAEKRLAMHLNDAQLSHLDSMAGNFGLTPLDLMATQGFMGEVCYCASLIMPDDDLCDLAKFALTSLHHRSGYPVASYLTQVLLYIDSFDDIDVEDWENFVWALSSNPEIGRDGNFAISWDDAVTISEIAADNLADNPELHLAVVLGLLNWSLLSLDGVTSPLKTLLNNISDPEPIRKRLEKCLNGEKFYAMNLTAMRRQVVKDATNFAKKSSSAETKGDAENNQE